MIGVIIGTGTGTASTHPLIHPDSWNLHSSPLCAGRPLVPASGRQCLSPRLDAPGNIDGSDPRFGVHGIGAHRGIKVVLSRYQSTRRHGSSHLEMAEIRGVMIRVMVDPV